MERSRMDLELVICNAIMEIEKPFKMSQLFETLEQKGIDDQDLILSVLDQLCDSGMVKYSEIEDDVWMFKRAV